MNKDLNDLMFEYRKIASDELGKVSFRKAAAAITIFLMLLIAREFEVLAPLTIASCCCIVIYFRGGFDTPTFEVDHSFYGKLAELNIVDKEGLEELQELFKEQAYLSLDDVEDFIEGEIKARNLANEANSEDVKHFLNKK